jgi:nicotinamide-nucleotide amidase
VRELASEPDNTGRPPPVSPSLRGGDAGPLADAVGVDPGALASLVSGLRERGETVATAESLTGGLLCALLTTIPGSSAVVRGGLVVYATPLKEVLAGVDGRDLLEYGPVHPLIAQELAQGARRTCGATWGVGMTGVAGPEPQGGIEPGTVHVAVARADHVAVRTIYLDGDRHEVRSATVRAALDLLRAQVAVQVRGALE